MNSFGTFQSYFEEHILQAEETSTVTWIGSVQVSLYSKEKDAH